MEKYLSITLTFLTSKSRSPRLFDTHVVRLFLKQTLEFVKQGKVAQILGEEKGSTRRDSRSSLANSEHEQHDEVSCVR